MILEALLGLVSWILDIILFPTQISALPAAFATTLARLLSYIARGASIVSAFLYPNGAYIAALLAFVITFNAVLSAFDLIMWILKKIPFINIH